MMRMPPAEAMLSGTDDITLLITPKTAKPTNHQIPGGRRSGCRSHRRRPTSTMVRYAVAISSL